MKITNLETTDDASPLRKHLQPTVDQLQDAAIVFFSRLIDPTGSGNSGEDGDDG